MRTFLFSWAAAILLALALSPASMAADPFTGMWRLDPSRTEDSNPPRITLIPITNGISLQVNQELPFVAYYTGKDYPIGAGNTLAALRVNDRTLVSTTKRHGKVLSKATLTVTDDGTRAITEAVESGKKEQCRTVTVGNRVGPAQSGDEFLGSWQQDPSQTRYDPPLMYNIKVSADTLRFRTNCANVTEARFDGKGYQQNASDNTLTLRRINDRTIVIVEKPPFARPTTSLWVVNGKTLTITSAGTGAEGKPFRRVLYFERLD